MQERFNKDLEEIKQTQYIMNNAINEIKTTLEGTNNTIMEAEDRISEVENTMAEINKTQRKKENRIKRNEDNLRDIWDNDKCPKIRIIGVPEEDKKKDPEKILEEIMASGPITSWEIDGETVETVSDFIFGGSKSLQMVAAAMKLKEAYSLEEKL